MEPNNGLGGGMFSGISSGLLGVDHNNPLQHQQSHSNQQQQQQQQQNLHHMHQPQMIPLGSQHDTDTHQQFQQEQIKHGSNHPPISAKNKHQQEASLSDEDDPDSTMSGDPNKRKNNSPWQRMKWTDTIVRLLIMAVYYIGDEGGSSEVTDPNGKKIKSTGLLQKKGKWKSVSSAMMEKGFYVSPQQCEDKFNDLNKRYKRVNDILGKGTACKVVENQNLLDTMDHLSPKMKEEVRKLLNSKHLFFREMCAYHNSFGHGANSGSVPQQVEVGSDASQAQQQQKQQQGQKEQQQRCVHSSDDGVANLGMLKVGCREEGRDDGDGDDDDDDDEEEEEDDDESEDYSDEDEDESGEGGSRGHQGGNGHEDAHEDDENNDHRIRSSRNSKRSRKASTSSIGCSIMSSSSQLMQQLSNEVSGVFQAGGKSLWEKKQWIRSRIVQLEEQQVSYQSQAFKLEKQRLKWTRFSSKKEREMERAKLENERRRVENERMVLLIRQKELELMNLQHLNNNDSKS